MRKLSITDSGVGMTPEQLYFYINHLAASSHELGMLGNYGVGAKVAAGSRNPHGLEYRCWHGGQGILACFKRGPAGRWGLEPQEWEDGHHDYWRPLTDSEKPWPPLAESEHGTEVVLLGRSARHDTTRAPASVTELRQQWVGNDLSSRFLTLPEHVELLVADLAGAGGRVERIHGKRHQLEQQALAGGTVELTDADAQ
jgi:hypothetical protein